ncbi:MAG: hypothetical protein ABI625_18445 [bacterium]
MQANLSALHQRSPEKETPMVRFRIAVASYTRAVVGVFDEDGPFMEQAVRTSLHDVIALADSKDANSATQEQLRKWVVSRLDSSESMLGREFGRVAATHAALGVALLGPRRAGQ